MDPQIETEASSTQAPAVSSKELLEALRRWRYFEKRHAVIVLGELDADRESAERAACRALHELRILADRVIASND